MPIIVFLRLICILSLLLTASNNFYGCSIIAPSDSIEIHKYAPGEFIIKFKLGVITFPSDKKSIDAKDLVCYSESIKALNKRYGLIKIERLFNVTPKGKGGETFSDTYKFIFADKTLDMEALASEYSKHREIIYAEPDYIATPQDDIVE